MKALLVIDMPNACHECPMCHFELCDIIGDVDEEIDAVDDRCPLKPMPDGAAEHLIQGLDAIEKATEKMKSVKVSVVRTSFSKEIEE